MTEYIPTHEKVAENIISEKTGITMITNPEIKEDLFLENFYNDETITYELVKVIGIFLIIATFAIIL